MTTTKMDSKTELLDIFDKDGNKIGVKSKFEVHRDGDWHKAAHIWIINPKTKEILIQKRSDDSVAYPGLWDISAAGHTDSGETQLDAAVRETSEEIKLTLKPTDLELLGSVIQQVVLQDGIYINNEFNDVFLAQLDITIETLKMQKGEVSALQMVPPALLEKWVNTGVGDLVPRPYEYPLLFSKLREKGYL